MAKNQFIKINYTQSQRNIPENGVTTSFSVFDGLSKNSKAVIIPLDDETFEYKSSSVRKALLNGLWKRAVDTNQASTFSTDFNMPPQESKWENSMVPQNYGIEPELEYYFGPVWYKRILSRPFTARYIDLYFDSVDYFADIVLNGKFLGRHEGYFSPFRFDVSDILPKDKKVELLLRVQDPLENCLDEELFLLQRKRWIKGTMNYHDSRFGGMPGQSTEGWTFKIGQSKPTGGIIGDSYLKTTGLVRIDQVFVTPMDIKGNLHLCLIVSNRSSKVCLTKTRWRILSPKGDQYEAIIQIRLQPGYNRLDIETQIEKPVLWYDASFGKERNKSSMYQIIVEAIFEDELSDVFESDFGIRTSKFPVEEEGWKYVLNDKPVFIRAANYIPIQHWVNTTKDFYEHDFKLLIEANLHSVGIHAHIQSPKCYEAADEMGISIFQDFPLQWAYASGSDENPGFIQKACMMISEMGYLLWNHPSVVYYCTHNEPLHMFQDFVKNIIETRFGGDITLANPKLAAILQIPENMMQEGNDMGNIFLDNALKSTLQRVDPFRFVHLSSGKDYDTHEYTGTIAGGSVYDLGEIRAPFVSEYGSWCIPKNAIGKINDWAKPWPPEGQALRRFKFEAIIWSEIMEMAGKMERYPDIESFSYATEKKSAFVLKYQTEFFRIERGNPYQGYRWHFFVNHWNYIGAGLLDKDRNPTDLYWAMKEASRPLLVAASFKNSVFEIGKLDIPVYVILDGYNKDEGTIYWRIEALDQCEIITAEADENLSVIGRHASGSYVFGLDEVKEVVLQGQIEFKIENNQTKLVQTIEFESKKSGSYRLILEWYNKESIIQHNAYSFYFKSANFEMIPGMVLVK